MEINKIHNMDCIEGLKKLEDNSVDCIFNDPWYYPENQRTRNAFENDTFWEITETWLRECKRVLKDSGHMFVSFSSQKMAKFEMLLAKINLPLQSRIVWHYRNAGGRCADKSRWGKTYEMVYHLSFGARLNFPEKWGDERFDVWTIAIPQSNFKDKKIHEFQKPLALLRRIISIGSHEGDLVLDCFMGSGTTAVVSKELGRDYLGFELLKENVDMANNRIETTQSVQKMQSEDEDETN